MRVHCIDLINKLSKLAYHKPIKVLNNTLKYTIQSVEFTPKVTLLLSIMISYQLIQGLIMNRATMLLTRYFHGNIFHIMYVRHVIETGWIHEQASRPHGSGPNIVLQ